METRRSWEKYFASMIVRCTLGKGRRGGQEPGVHRDQQALRRDLINIISFILLALTLRRSIVKYTIIASLHYSCLLNKFSVIKLIQVLAVRIPHAKATT